MKKEKIVAIIPSRMASSRLPGKPLLKIYNLELIEHVRRRALLVNFLMKYMLPLVIEKLQVLLAKIMAR